MLIFIIFHESVTDGRTDGPTVGRTDRPTYGGTDPGFFYRDARTLFDRRLRVAGAFKRASLYFAFPFVAREEERKVINLL